MTELPLVSIVINNYNYGRYLGQAIDSALQQTYPHVEVVVVDDGSTDSSREIIAGYGQQLRPVLKQNGGQASAFNAGFEASRGAIICLLDADDRFVPTKVETVVSHMAADPGAGWCFHALQLIDSQEAPLEVLPRTTPGRYDVRQDHRRGRIPISGPATTGTCLRRELLGQILPMPTAKSISICADRYMKLVALSLAPGIFLDEPLAVLRIHGANNFSLRADNQPVKARIDVLTAYWIWQRFPALKQLTNRLLANGLSLYRRTSTRLDADAAEAVQAYFAASSFRERCWIRLASAYFAYRQRSRARA